MARRSKPRRSIAWGRLFAFLTIVNVAAGLLFSRATAATKVTVTGGDAVDSQFLFLISQSLKGTPCLRVQPFDVEDELVTNQRIGNAKLRRNLFGRAQLSLKYRTPVALVVGSKQVVLTSDGRLVDWGGGRESGHLNVTVELPPEALRAQVGVCGSWDSQSVAKACEFVASSVAKELQSKVSVESTGKVSLNLPDGSRAILGFPDDLDEKFGRLVELIGTHQRSQNRYEFNLTMPTRPVVKRL